MGKNETKFFVDGTAALKVDRKRAYADSPSFVAFHGSSQHSTKRQNVPQRSVGSGNRLVDAVVDAFERSEMACSLMLEDVKGVPYGLLSNANIATLSIACGVVATLSIIFGA